MKGLSRFFIMEGLIFLLSMPVFSQNAKYQTDIVYRLSRHVEWPRQGDEYKFVIGVVGNAEDLESFRRMALDRHTIKDRQIEVRYFECTDAIDECQLLYISDRCEIKIEKIVRKTKNDPILIVSSGVGYGKAGSIVNFVDDLGKLKFELNKAQAAKRGLEISEELQGIAVVI